MLRIFLCFFIFCRFALSCRRFCSSRCGYEGTLSFFDIDRWAWRGLAPCTPNAPTSTPRFSCFIVVFPSIHARSPNACCLVAAFIDVGMLCIFIGHFIGRTNVVVCVGCSSAFGTFGKIPKILKISSILLPILIRIWWRVLPQVYHRSTKKSPMIQRSFYPDL